MRRRLVPLLVLAALASTAAAPPPVRRLPPPGMKPAPKEPAAPAPGRVVISKPVWTDRPSGDDLLRYYPEAAFRRGIGGKAVIACTVNAQGRLESCQVESESPAGENFGAAALRMAPLFGMRPTNADGVPVEGARVRIPIVFNPPDPTEESKPDYSMKGWITTGPPPAPPPISGRFAYILTRSPKDTTPGAALYVVLPEAPPVDGKVEVWTLIALDLPDDAPAAYVMGSQTFDCANRSVSDPALQLFSRTGRLVGWSVRETADWTPVAQTDQFLIRSLDLACGFAKPPGQSPGSLAAALADAPRRFGR